MRTFLATKFSREDFPPSVPAETVDRILAVQEARDRLSVWHGAGMVMSTIVFCLLIISPELFAWPQWTRGLAGVLTGVMMLVSNLVSGRSLHRVVVEQGFRCPKCHEALFTDTWSMKKQQAQRDALIQGRCPRCFEHAGPVV
jgi:hypothetical protein